MSKVIIEIPEEILRSAKVPPAEISERFKQELALRLYEQQILTFGKAREFAGLTKWEFHKLLGKSGITRNYDLEELERDLKTLESIY
jgi:predicted HTH domain antitoxin